MQMEQGWVRGQSAALTHNLRQIWAVAFVLFKVRIVTLLLLSAFGGAALGHMATGNNSAGAWLLLTFAGTLSAMGASGINQYIERDRDTKMKRTAKRPLATGQISRPEVVLWVGIGMVALATGVSAIVNLWLAFWIFMGAAIYVGIYTIWLKPRTTLNIVIGGAAGSCAVISGGAAMGAWNDPAVWLLAGLVFAWTPVHFWALALAYREDYKNADYPMLPSQVSAAAAAKWTALHTVFTVLFGLGLGLWPATDWFYLVPIGIASLMLIKRTIELMQTPEKSPALGLFHYSNLYLAAVLVVVLLAPLWR